MDDQMIEIFKQSLNELTYHNDAIKILKNWTSIKNLSDEEINELLKETSDFLNEHYIREYDITYGNKRYFIKY